MSQPANHVAAADQEGERRLVVRVSNCVPLLSAAVVEYSHPV